MKCDSCGCQFPAHEAATDSRNEGGPGGRMPYTKLVSLTLCRDCAASRTRTRQFVLRLGWVAIAVFVVLCGMPFFTAIGRWLFGSP
jgi:hypothetical protein